MQFKYKCKIHCYNNCISNAEYCCLFKCVFHILYTYLKYCTALLIQHPTILKLTSAADFYKPMLPQHTVRRSISHRTSGADSRQSAAPFSHSVSPHLTAPLDNPLVTFRPAEGSRLSWPHHAVD